MTPKKYEHLGRAVMLAADLAQGVEKLVDTRKALAHELLSLMPEEAADKAAKMIMNDSFPVYRMGDIIRGIANTVAACDADGKKEGGAA